jgi:RNA polymerase sigma factor (sigma-70 family)
MDILIEPLWSVYLRRSRRRALALMLNRVRCESGSKGFTMSSYTDSQTSITLLDLLRQDPRDSDAWERFVLRYRPKIYAWCREWGLQEADAEDVAQDVLVKLTEKMSSFRYDPSRCFRAWLKTITQHAWSDLIASRYRAVEGRTSPSLTSVEARIDLEKRIEQTFDREVLELAIVRVKERVAPPTWDAFRLTALEGQTGVEASRFLGVPVATVFVSKHRVQKMLRKEISVLEEAGDD